MEDEEIFIIYATSSYGNFYKTIKNIKIPDFYNFSQMPWVKWHIFSWTTRMFANEDYKTFITTINNMLSTEKLNRKQSNIKQQKQHLFINNKVKTQSTNEVKSIVNSTSSRQRFKVVKWETASKHIDWQKTISSVYRIHTHCVSFNPMLAALFFQTIL